MKKLILILCVLSLALSSGHVSGADGYMLVVNGANPTDELSKKEIAKMFLKRAKRWPDDVAVVPVDQPEKSGVRKAFTLDIHKKSVSAIKSYWQRMIFSGRDVNPQELDSDAAVLEFVRKERGAIGYVSSGTELGSDVKELVAVD